MSTPAAEFLQTMRDYLVVQRHVDPSSRMIQQLDEEIDRASVNWQERYERSISAGAIEAERWKSTRMAIESERDNAIQERNDARADLQTIKRSLNDRIAELENERNLAKASARDALIRLREFETENARLQLNEVDMRAAVIKELFEKLFS